MRARLSEERTHGNDETGSFKVDFHDLDIVESGPYQKAGMSTFDVEPGLAVKFEVVPGVASPQTPFSTMRCRRALRTAHGVQIHVHPSIAECGDH